MNPAERQAVKELVAAHDAMGRLSEEINSVRAQRRAAAAKLVELGRGTSWIARQIGVSPQAVDGFMNYRDRKQRKAVSD